ncbi:signal peptide-containing protein [Cryptosporidium hominis]
MLSKRKLAVILPMLFELAMSYDYYFPLDTVPLEHIATNRWGKEGPAGNEKVVKIGSIGGGYYGRTVPGLRDYEKGNAKDRAFGSKYKEYPYAYEAERTLTKDSLAPLPPEARIRMMREAFREHVFNVTGQVPTLGEVKKMKKHFMDYVKKELNATDTEIKSLFGVETTKKVDGVLPKYLLFDDMDKFDFDPEEALKHMPRVPINASKEEIDAAYLKAWEMLGKSNDKLRKVYNEYRRKYLEKNPLGPVMTEKEFLLYSIKLREREAHKLGFVSGEANSDPISKSIEISYFLRDALKDEYEKYKSSAPIDRFANATNFVNDGLFNDNLIIDNLDPLDNSLPSPYDPIEGRAWTDTISKSSIINMTDAYEKIVKGEDVYDNHGRLVYKGDRYSTRSDGSDIGEQFDQSITGIDHDNRYHSIGTGSSNINGKELENNQDSSSTPFHKLTRVNKYNNIKSPSQLLFERSEYSTSSQKRVIDRIDDYTLVDINNMTVGQMLSLHTLIFENLYTDADVKEEEKYFKQRLGEQGGDVGTNTEVYREFLFNKFGNSLFFIPKTIYLKEKNNEKILPVSATGFKLVENFDGVAKIHHLATDLSFNIDYSDKDSFYLNGYLGKLSYPHKNLLENFLTTGWKLSDSQAPSPYRFISAIDDKVSSFDKFESTLAQYRDHIETSDDLEKKEMAGKITAHLARSAQLLKRYEEKRNEYIRSQKKLLDELNKSKSVLRTKALLENVNKVSSALKGSDTGIDVSKYVSEPDNKKFGSFFENRDELKNVVENEHENNLQELQRIGKECHDNFRELEDACDDLIRDSSLINVEISSLEDEITSKVLESLDKRQRIGVQILDDLDKLEKLNDYLLQNAHEVGNVDITRIELDDFEKNPEISKTLDSETFGIFSGDRKASDFKKLIDTNYVSTRYYIEEPKNGDFVDSDEGDDEEETKGGKKKSGKGSDKSKKASKYSTDFKGKVKLVFEEALTIIEDHVRDLYIAVADRKERMSELLKLEAFLIREVSRHRKSLSVVLNRVALPEDEIIDENENDELKMRILLKIHEEKTKLMYVREVLDKLYFYPHFRGVKPSSSLKLKELEERGILSRFGYTYLPKFKLGEDEQPIGIYGFKKLDYYDMKLDFYNRLISGFEYDLSSYRFDLEMMSLLDSLKYPELNKLIYSDDYIESSIFTKRTKLMKLLKKLILREKNKDLRRSLKRAYFEIREWFDNAVRFEREYYGSSALETIFSESKSSDDGSSRSESAIVLSDKKGSSPSPSNKQQRRMRRKN